MTGARVSVEPNLDRACFFTYVYQFSRKNIKVEFWPKIPGNIPKHNAICTFINPKNIIFVNFYFLENKISNFSSNPKKN